MELYNKYFMKQKMMRTLLKTLVIILIFSIYFQGLRVLALTFVNVLAACIVEFIFEKKINKKTKISEAAIVTAILYTFTLPVSLPLWISIVGIMVGIFFGKMVFGGFGRNIFNPALVGRAFIYINFPQQLTIFWNETAKLGDFPGGFTKWIYPILDQNTAATPMIDYKASGVLPKLQDLLIGDISGVIGETSKILIIILAIYLVYKKVASWEIMVGSAIGFTALSYILIALGFEEVMNPLYGMLVGGFLLGTCFMATDPISAAKTPTGKWLYGIIVGIVTVIIRSFALFAGGMMFAILIGNTFAPIIDYTVKYFKSRKKEVRA